MPHRGMEEALSRLLQGRTRAERRNAARFVREEARRVERVQEAVRMSGAGYPVDQGLRKLLWACNDDVIAGAEVPFATVWDVFSGFVKRERGQMMDLLLLREEKDHAFSPEDFFAYAGEEEIAAQALPRLRDLRQGVIHSYSCVDGPQAAERTEDGGDAVVFSGISLVRHGSRLYWLTAGGKRCDLEAETAARRAMLREREAEVRRANPGASEERIRGVLEPSAVPLPGTDDAWLTYAAGLFNLDTASHEIRLVARDWSNTLAVFADHFEERFAEGYGADPQVTRLVDKAVDEVEASRLFFEVAEAAFALPAYFAARVRLVVQKEVPTMLAEAGGEARRRALKAPLALRPQFRKVATLAAGGGRKGGPGSYSPPQYRVEVDGFWRRLQPGSMGRDAAGSPVEGMTWVRGHARWKDRPPRTGNVWFKSPVGDALRKAAAMGGEGRIEA